MVLRGTIEAVSLVPARTRERMFELLDTHFLRANRESFERDLAEKHWTILLSESATGELVGFSTMMLMEREVDGRPVRAVFSGDTIIDRGHWGDTELARVWIGHLVRVAAEAPDRPTYWFLTSMGHRTYRVLSLFFSEYHPRPGGRIRAFERRVLDELATQRFASAYERDTGIIHFDPPRECLRPDIARVTPAQEGHALVRFFVERNPGHARGDELACLALVREENLTRFARRLLARGSAPRGEIPAPAP